jgi:hypothetical protein
MIEDWKQAIAVAWLVKEAMMELDHGKLYSYHLPEVAATEEQIRLSEEHLGFKLDPRYRGFLRYANGWKCFLQTTDLFGTEDLVRGPRNECGQFLLSMLDHDVLQKSGAKRTELLPIAASFRDRDLCVIFRPDSPKPGVVLWFGGEEIERFASFDHYFLAMTDYNRLEVQRFKNERK